MKFQLIVWFVVPTHTILRTSKASGIAPWKKCYLATALALAIQDVLNRRLLFKTVGSGNKETITIIFAERLELGEKTVDAAKICGGAENIVKTETQQTFVNGLLGFITLGIYTPLEARIMQ